MLVRKIRENEYLSRISEYQRTHLQLWLPCGDTAGFVEGFIRTMKTTLSFVTPAELETESLVAIALDQSEKDATSTDQSRQGKGKNRNLISLPAMVRC